MDGQKFEIGDIVERVDPKMNFGELLIIGKERNTYEGKYISGILDGFNRTIYNPSFWEKKNNIFKIGGKQ